MFFEMALDDARRYCALLDARRPLRLAELATVLHGDGQDLDGFDASLSSYGRLYDWYLGFVRRGCPGVPDEVWVDLTNRERPHHWSARDVVGPRAQQAVFVAEGLRAHVATMYLRADPGSHFVAYNPRQKNDGERHMPAIAWTEGVVRPFWDQLLTTADLVSGRHEQTPSAAEMVHRVGTSPWIPTFVVDQLDDPGPSVLAGLPPATWPPPLPWPELPPEQGGPLHQIPGYPARPGIDDGPAAVPTSDDPSASAGTDQLWLHRGRNAAALTALDDRPTRLKPLDPVLLRAWLAARGFSRSNVDAEASLELDLDADGDEQQFVDGSGGVEVQVVAYGGAVRAVTLQVYGAEPEVTDRLVADWRALARQLRARITPDEQVPWE